MRRVRIKKNETYVVKFENLSSDGAGIGRIGGFVVFCEGALPGETAEIKIIKVTTSYAVGKLLKIIDSSPDRIEPEYEQCAQCGGCTYAHYKYEAQLKTKEQYVVDCLTRIGGIINYTLLPIVGMENPKHYRNKAQYPLGYDDEGKVVTGFYAKRSHRLIPADTCVTEDLRAQKVRSFVASYMTKNNIPVYNEKTHQGLVRHIVIRTSSIHEDAMLVLVLREDAFPNKEDFLNELNAECPFVKSVYFNINPKVTNVILGDEFIHIYGKERLEDAIDGVNFLLSPMSFFQVNPKQTEVLYGLVNEFAEFEENDNVLDLYCGIGTIGIYLAKKNRINSLTGVEVVEEAVNDAKVNADINNVDNARFLAGDATEVVKELMKEGMHFDVTIIDPPRKGCDEELLKLLAEIKSERIVYVSCNPATLARDLKYLTANGYDVNKVCPVDLFPWTSHVECVTLMSRVKD
ncbi:MAG TPA: 23S rRNA (uracil(1939)-C(5))-methyltransferase RlmD [Clostridia bacterium]|nr:23S rRNA (uracil(1939)-C(5))-methyltransferase RlmD [Clostridia bacterium]